jgi:hypothetical protein
MQPSVAELRTLLGVLSTAAISGHGDQETKKRGETTREGKKLPITVRRGETARVIGCQVAKSDSRPCQTLLGVLGAGRVGTGQSRLDSDLETLRRAEKVRERSS